MKQPQHAKWNGAGRPSGCRLQYPVVLVIALAVVLGTLVLARQDVCRAQAAEEPAAAEQPAEKTCQKDPYKWQDLFDGKTLKGWKVPKFGGEGKVTVKDGAIVLGMGESLTGITWTGKVPTEDYECTWEGKRTLGYDFFCTLTFPVGKDHVSFVTGGWGGTVVGISCVDWYDASDNITSQFMSFDDKKWYPFRVRVTKKKIEAWVGDEKKVDLEREGHKFSIRDEVDLSRPLGISAWMTEGMVRKIRIRKLKPEEAAAVGKEEK